MSFKEWYVKTFHKHKITYGKCGWIRTRVKSPSGGLTVPYNSASFCPKCENCGGVVEPYNGEDIIQMNKKQKNRFIETGGL